MNTITIGIGITTTPNREDFLNICVSQIGKYTDTRYNLFINNDKDGEGVAKSKNRCLTALKSYDHIFMFDDDCFPISRGWEKYMSNEGFPGQNHFLYLNNWGKITALQKDEDGVVAYNNCGGCMMYLTKEVIAFVGFMDEQYGRYGFEHADYSARIHKCGFSKGTTPYLCPQGASEYLHSLDYDGPIFLDGHGQVRPRPSMTTADTLTALAVSSQRFRDRWS